DRLLILAVLTVLPVRIGLRLRLGSRGRTRLRTGGGARCGSRRSRRRRLGGAAVLVRQRAAQIGLAPASFHRQRFDPRLLDDDVRNDALGLDRPAGGRVVARRSQPDGTVARDGDDGLDRALAEGVGADDQRPLMVLKRSRHDLGGGGGAAVDQHDHGKAGGDIAGGCTVALNVFLLATAGGDDLALFQEVVGYGDRLVQQAARIVPKVEQDAAQIVAHLLLQPLYGIAQPLVGLLAEGGDADIAHILFGPRADRLDANDVPRQGHVERRLFTPPNGQLQRGLRRAAHPFHGFGQSHAL